MTVYLFDLERVEAAERTAEFAAAVEKNASRGKRTREQRKRRFSRKYNDWRAALSDACKAMHSLNRYAKHATCRAPHRDQIYALKNCLIKLLYEQGCVVELVKPYTDYPPRECRACYGTGLFRCGMDPCRRCDGTGKYGESIRREFLAFCFSVDGNNYKWHQPVEMVTFDYSAPSEAQFIDPAELAAEKPIALKRHQLATAKALIEWVITQQEAPQKGAG